MEMLEFSQTVLATERKCVEFLQMFGIIPDSMPCVCGQEMALRDRKQRSGKVNVMWRCSRKHCRKEISVRSNCSFLAYKRSDERLRSSLTLSKILQITYTWLQYTPTCRQLRDGTKCCLQSIVDWLNLCREVTSHAVESLSEMVGTPEQPIQVDEAYFSGRRKYNKGRLLEGDIGMQSGCNRSNNYGDQVTGPWVLCIYKSKENQRFVVLPDRKGTTLLPLIKKYVQPGSTIVTDEWSGYNRLSELGYDHQTVNHTENYVNPITGYHTQGVERAWVDAKAWLKKVRYPSPFIQSHLDEISWRKYNKGNILGLLHVFLTDVAQFYTKKLPEL